MEGVPASILQSTQNVKVKFWVVGGAQHPLPIFPAVFSAVNAGSYQTVLTRSI